MKLARRLLMGLLITLGVIRLLGYFGYALLMIPSPLETYYLEAKMVLLAWRAQAGLTLYPEWRHYPHVTDFYSPAYFAVVGLVGRAAGSDLRGLYLIGRVVSFAAGLATSALVGVVAARRYGRPAGFASALLCAAATPMAGFSVMTRPDTMAESLGVVGFFLATGRGRPARVVGGGVLALAALTKQTAAIFLATAVLTRILEGDWKRGLALGLGSAALLVGAVGAVTLLVEPNFARSLLGDSGTPWLRHSFNVTFERMYTSAQDTLYFPILGLALWSTRATGRRDTQLGALAGVLLATSVVTSAKQGSDINYYLSLRAVEGLAAGALWHALATSTGRARRAGLALAAVLGILAVAPSTQIFVLRAVHAWDLRSFFASPGGRGMLAFYAEARRLAADPNAKLLTDVGDIDLYARDRAAFGDPFLFRILADTGRLDPGLMRERIDSQYYDLVITSSEIEKKGYDTYEFGLPMVLAERVRERYVRVDTRAGLFLYQRRPAGTPGGPAGTEPPRSRP